MASVPAHIGRFVIERELGRGGMGVVYLAHDPSLGRRVAVKVLDGRAAGDAGLVARLEREARLLAALSHPNVAVVYGLEAADGAPLVVMEFVEGESLEGPLGRGAMREQGGERAAVEMCAQIARGVAAAHERGIVHRDLTPRNVMVGAGGLVKVLDFGLARQAEAEGAAPESGTTATSISGMVAGTPGYMSPEQVRGEAVDGRTDVFAFGCILYECLAGAPAFGGRTQADRMARTLSGPTDWGRLPAGTTPALRVLLERCLRAEAGSRPRDMGEVRGEIEAILAGAAGAARKGNLPAPVTSFVGRERELEEVRSLTASSRLLTLVGAGGVGKTRLAVEATAGIEGRYAGGVWLIELAALVDPALVPQALGAVLGVKEEPGRPLMETVVGRLRERETLVILDNCEHVIGACAVLADTMLRLCPPLSVLATSREALGVPGERVYRVPSLSVPPATAGMQTMAGSGAVRLFLDRAGSLGARSGPAGERMLAVGEVCRRLDGIPLAIELAAARAGAMSVEDIARRLTDRFGLLTGGSRTVLPRQRTLRAMVDWSYDLLGDAHKAVLRRLSVFSGGWTLEAAEAVCADGRIVKPGQVAGLLAELVGKSLVQFDDAGEGGRYRFLETIRQDARERLEKDVPAAAATRERHARWFLGLAQKGESAMSGPEQGAWLERLAVEHDNMRAALEFARASADAALGLTLAATLRRFWYVRGHEREARGWLEWGVGARAAAADALQARGCQAVGVFAWRQGDRAAARVWYERSLRLFEALGDRANAASTLSNLGVLAKDDGRTGDARAAHERALTILAGLGDSGSLARAQLNLGGLLMQEGRYAEAEGLFTKCLVQFRVEGNHRLIATALHNLGESACRRGEADEAACDRFRESVRIWSGMAEERPTADSLMWWGVAECHRGRNREAVLILALSDALRRKAGRHVPEPDRAEYERIVDRVCRTVGPAVFEEVWAAGAGTTVDAILAANSGRTASAPHSTAHD